MVRGESAENLVLNQIQPWSFHCMIRYCTVSIAGKPSCTLQKKQRPPKKGEINNYESVHGLMVGGRKERRPSKQHRLIDIQRKGRTKLRWTILVGVFWSCVVQRSSAFGKANGDFSFCCFTLRAACWASTWVTFVVRVCELSRLVRLLDIVRAFQW